MEVNYNPGNSTNSQKNLLQYLNKERLKVPKKLARLSLQITLKRGLRLIGTRKLCLARSTVSIPYFLVLKISRMMVLSEARPFGGRTFHHLLRHVLWIRCPLHILCMLLLLAINWTRIPSRLIYHTMKTTV